MKRKLTQAGAVLGFLIVAVGGLTYLNLSLLVLATQTLPGVSFSELNLTWNTIELKDFEFSSPELKRVTLRSDLIRVSPDFLSFLSATERIESIEIEAPYVYLERRPDGSLLLPFPATSQEKSSSDPTPLKSTTSVHVARVDLSSGRGEFLDRSVGRPYAHYRIKDVHLSLRDLTYPPSGTNVPVELSFVLEGQPEGTAQLTGWLDPAGNSADLEIEVSDFDVHHVHPYVRNLLKSAPLLDGALDTSLKVEVEKGVYSVNGDLSLLDLKIEPGAGDFLSIPLTLFSTHLQQYQNSLAIPIQIEGDLNEDVDHQDQIVRAFLESVTRHLVNNTDLISDVLGEEGIQGLQDSFQEMKDKARDLQDLWK